MFPRRQNKKGLDIAKTGGNKQNSGITDAPYCFTLRTVKLNDLPEETEGTEVLRAKVREEFHLVGEIPSLHIEPVILSTNLSVSLVSSNSMPSSSV